MHPYLGISGPQGPHIAENEVAGAVTAKSLFIMALHDGEGREYVLRIVFVEAVEVKEQRIEFGRYGRNITCYISLYRNCYIFLIENASRRLPLTPGYTCIPTVKRT